MYTEFLNKLDEAQMVLVGIGKEMEEDFSGMEKDPFYSSLLSGMQEEEQERLLPYLKLHYRTRQGNLRLQEAYGRLAELLAGKNYFVVTLCTDDYIYGAGLDEGRIVAPCGGYRAMQCVRTNEAGELCCHAASQPLVTDQSLWESVLEGLDRAWLERSSKSGGAGSPSPKEEEDHSGPLSTGNFPKKPSPWEYPRCAECGSPLSFNQMGVPGYREDGYLPQWERYTKWLQGTLNRKLCVLELGAGMEYPSVIRFPFEKVAFFNQKAYLFRVHSRLYQLTEELKGRGRAVKEAPASFLAECGRERAKLADWPEQAGQWRAPKQLRQPAETGWTAEAEQRGEAKTAASRRDGQ